MISWTSGIIDNMLDLLNQIGLDDGGARVYVALLELGPSTVSEITKKAGITRTLGYVVLEKLATIGLVDQVSGRGTKKIFTAQHPRSLVQYAKNRKNQMERDLNAVEKQLPDLVSLYKFAEKPIIRYAEGQDGVKNIFNETLESETEILSILDIDGWIPEFGSWGKEYNKERSKRKIYERILMLDTKQGREWKKYYRGSFKYSHFRWIKPEQLPGMVGSLGEINIYEDKVVLALLEKPNLMGVMVQSRPLAGLLKAMFELAWRAGKAIKIKK